jgi:AraC-like DNA-binding protein
MREIQRHGNITFPIAAYEWHASEENYMRLECHRHSEWEFFSMISGRAYVSVDGVRKLLSAGDVALFHGGSLHMAEAESNLPFKYRAVVFHPNIVYGLGDIVQTKYIIPFEENRLNVNPFILQSEIGDSVVSVFNKLYMLITETPPVYEIFGKACLYEMLAAIFSLSGEFDEKNSANYCHSKKIKEIINYINSNYASPITVRELAEMANMSQGHFTRLFKRFTAKSPIDYLIGVRLSKALAMLCDTDEKLINIAVDTGFNSMSYFIRMFNAYFGCSPSKYRKNNAM